MLCEIKNIATQWYLSFIRIIIFIIPAKSLQLLPS